MSSPGACRERQIIPRRKRRQRNRKKKNKKGPPSGPSLARGKPAGGSLTKWLRAASENAGAHKQARSARDKPWRERRSMTCCMGGPRHSSFLAPTAPQNVRGYAPRAEPTWLHKAQPQNSYTVSVVSCSTPSMRELPTRAWRQPCSKSSGPATG